MYLGYFTKDEEFPFFIQYGYHETPLDFHKHTDFLELVIVLSGSAMHHVNNDDAYFIKKGDILNWIIERPDGTKTEIKINQKESNKY